MSAFGRDSPDGTCTGVNTRGFPGFLQGRSEVRTATAACCGEQHVLELFACPGRGRRNSARTFCVHLAPPHPPLFMANAMVVNTPCSQPFSGFPLGAHLGVFVFFQWKFGNRLAMLIHNGHSPVREIGSVHNHASCPKLAGNLPSALAGRLYIREIKLVFRKGGRLV